MRIEDQEWPALLERLKKLSRVGDSLALALEALTQHPEVRGRTGPEGAALSKKSSAWGSIPVLNLRFALEQYIEQRGYRWIVIGKTRYVLDTASVWHPTGTQPEALESGKFPTLALARAVLTAFEGEA